LNCGKVEALLKAHDEPGSFLEKSVDGGLAEEQSRFAPADKENASLGLHEASTLSRDGGGSHDETVPPSPPEGKGTRIGPYKLLQLIGDGGMGAVWMAEQQEPVRRIVALKLVKAGMDSAQVLARFEAERQALALMDHPNIAKVFDGGKTSSGRPYFVMELVKGTPITKFCDQHRLPIRQRLELFVSVCQAIQHAHQKGIIHRDIKPSNVLVAPYDSRPVVKVIDFGVAKAMGQRLTERTMFTEFGAVVGTLQYMSPEQAELNNQDIDTRSDIYSLGVLLYELLTGTTPLDIKRLQGTVFAALLMAIIEEEAPKPSTRLTDSKESLPSISAQRQTEPAKLSKLMRGELDCIALKALAKDRGRRYETANAFAGDIQHYLADEPVEAQPPSARYRLSKFLRRNKGPVLAVASVAVALVGGVSSVLVVQALANRALAGKNDQLAAKNTELADEQAKVQAEQHRTEEALLAEAKRRKQARQALDAMSSQIVEDWLAQQRTKDLSDAEKKFLQTALEYYEEFARDTGADEASRAGVAAAYLRVGRIRTKLGQMSDAEAAYRRSADLYALLAANSPTVPEYRRDLAASHTQLGIVMRATGRPKQAEVAYRESLAILEQLAAESSPVPDYRSQLAKIHLNLGNLLQDNGQFESAEAAYQEALKRARKLLAEFPEDPAYQRALALVLTNSGNLFTSVDRDAEAAQSYGEARNLLFSLVARLPDDASSRGQLADICNSLGNLHSKMHQTQKGQEAHHQGLDQWMTLTRDFPRVAEYRLKLGRSAINYGLVLIQGDRLQDAEKAYRQAVEVLEPLVMDISTVPEYRWELAFGLYNLGTALRDMHQHLESEKAFQRARSFYEQLVTDFPQRAEFQNELADTLHGLAELSLAESDLRQAQSLLESTLQHRKAAVRRNPRHKNYLDSFRTDSWQLADVHARQGEHAQVARTVSECLQVGAGQGPVFYAATRLLARCVTLVKEDQRLSDAQRKELAHSYADEAMAALRQAIQNGYEEVTKLKADTDLDPLRNRDDFKKLLQELETKAKQKASEPGPK